MSYDKANGSTFPLWLCMSSVRVCKQDGDLVLRKREGEGGDGGARIKYNIHTKASFALCSRATPIFFACRYRLLCCVCARLNYKTSSPSSSAHLGRLALLRRLRLRSPLSSLRRKRERKKRGWQVCIRDIQPAMAPLEKKVGNGTALQKKLFCPLPPEQHSGRRPGPKTLELCGRRGQSLAKEREEGRGRRRVGTRNFFPSSLSDGNAKFQRKLSADSGEGGREAKKGGMGGRKDPERGGGGSILFLPSIPSPHFSDDCKEEGARNGVRSPAARLNIESRWIARPTLPHPFLPSEREREEKKAAASAMFYPISPERSEAASTLYSSTTQLLFFLRRVFVCCCSLLPLLLLPALLYFFLARFPIQSFATLQLYLGRRGRLGRRRGGGPRREVRAKYLPLFFLPFLLPPSPVLGKTRLFLAYEHLLLPPPSFRCFVLSVRPSVTTCTIKN